MFSQYSWWIILKQTKFHNFAKWPPIYMGVVPKVRFWIPLVVLLEIKVWDVYIPLGDKGLKRGVKILTWTKCTQDISSYKYIGRSFGWSWKCASWYPTPWTGALQNPCEKIQFSIYCNFGLCFRKLVAWVNEWIFFHCIFFILKFTIYTLRPVFFKFR